jgi:hypothetical protein
MADTLTRVEETPGAQGRLLDTVRSLVAAGAEERTEWIRANIRKLMRDTARDAIGISALSGVSATTVRAFLNDTDSSITNVLKIALTLGVSLADLERPPDAFATLLSERRRTASDGSTS